MAVKSVVLLCVVLTSLVLVFQDVAYARELTEANESERKNVKPAGEPGFKDVKWVGGYKHGGGYGNDGWYSGGYGNGGGYDGENDQPSYGGDYGPGYGGGYGSGFGRGYKHHGHSGSYGAGYGGGSGPRYGGRNSDPCCGCGYGQSGNGGGYGGGNNGGYGSGSGYGRGGYGTDKSP